MKTEISSWLHKNNACSQSVMWVNMNNIQSLEEAWNACNRGDWLLWLAQKLGINRRKLAMCGALCAHTAVQYMEDARSREAIRVAFLWSQMKATDKEVVAARHNASLAFCESEGPLETWATRAALSAIEIANDGDKKYRTNTATTAVAAVSWAVEATQSAAAVEANQIRTANIVKKVLTEDVIAIIKTTEL